MTNDESIQKNYSRVISLKLFFIFICIVSCILLIGISVTVSGLKIGFTDVYKIIIDHIFGNDISGTRIVDDYVIWNINLPRAIFACIAGAGLAVAGTVMQSVMKNPFVDPYTTGISSGACFGVALAIILGISFVNISGMGVVINAFIFALIPMGLILFLSPTKKTSPATLVLIGVSLSYMLNALDSIVLSIASDETLAQIYNWQIGSFFSITWDDVSIPLLFVVTGTIIMTMISKKLNVLALGDNEAKSLGLDVETLRIILLIIISLMVAAVVSFAGIIGFVGLVVPHIIRLIIGSDNKFVIPASAAFGAVFLLGCDIICRMINDGAVPVGVIVSLIGAPIFIILVIKSKNVW
jgi:iron complex transport system permease protein